ncbi:hypothetical protein [Desulfobacterium sp. N47]
MRSSIDIKERVGILEKAAVLVKSKSSAAITMLQFIESCLNSLVWSLQ